MEVKAVGYAALGQLRPPSHGDIQRSIQRAQWTPAQRQIHARNMQQLGQRARQFAAMQKTAGRAPNRASPARHNSVAQRGYSGSRRIGNAAWRYDNSHLPQNIRRAIARNVKRIERAERRRQFRQQFAARCHVGARAVGNRVRQSLSARTAQAVRAFTAQTNPARVKQAVVRRSAPQRVQQPQRKEQQRGQGRAR